MLTLEITSWSGFSEAPVVVQADGDVHEAQPDRPRPRLRLVQTDDD